MGAFVKVFKDKHSVESEWTKHHMTDNVINASIFIRYMNEEMNKYHKSNWGFDMLFVRYINDEDICIDVSINFFKRVNSKFTNESIS